MMSLEKGNFELLECAVGGRTWLGENFFFFCKYSFTLRCQSEMSFASLLRVENSSS